MVLLDGETIDLRTCPHRAHSYLKLTRTVVEASDDIIHFDLLHVFLLLKSEINKKTGKPGGLPLESLLSAGKPESPVKAFL